MPSPYRYWVAVMVGLGAAFRFHSFFANHFRADEALFAGWAREIAVWRDPLLLLQPVDKPPLLFYLQALAYPFFGPVEWAARLPNFIASLLLVPLLGLLAWRLYGDGLTAVIAAAFLALSPLAIQFSATAFTDPLLTFWLVAAFVLTVRPANAESGGYFPALTGVAFGLAVATKYQAWLFLPLLIALAILAGWSRRDWLRAMVGAGVIGLIVGLWVLARADAGSLVALQVANAGGLRLAWSWELWPRLAMWAGLWRDSLGWPTALIGLLTLDLLAFRQYRVGRTVGWLTSTDMVLSVSVLGYSVAHWLFAVPVWDRYLLPLWPLVILLLARAASGAVRWFEGERFAQSVRWRPAFAALAIGSAALLISPASAARLGRYPIGGQPSADQGAWFVAEFLQDQPYGTVLYDHWYSWQWSYHLFDTGVYVSWFPHSDALLEDLAVFGDDGSPRFLVLPDSPVADPIRRAVANAGYDLLSASIDRPADSDLHMTLYRITRQTP